MNRIVLVFISVIFSANLCLAEEYRTTTIHHKGLFEALGGLVVTAVVLPFAIVGGLVQELVGSDEVIVTKTPQTAAMQAVVVVPAVYTTPVAQVVYNQPLYTTAPMNPGYQYDYWYWQPDNKIVFVVGKEHRRHQCNTDGRQVQHANYPNGQQGRVENHGGRQVRHANDARNQTRRYDGNRGGQTSSNNQRNFHNTRYGQGQGSFASNHDRLRHNDRVRAKQHAQSHDGNRGGRQ